MRLKLYILTVITFWIAGCEPKEGCTDPHALNFDANAGIDNGSCVTELAISQDQLNNASFQLTGELTGFVVDPDAVAHDTNPSTLAPDSTLRIVWSSLASGAQIASGTVFTKRIFRRNPDGSRGARLSTVVMVKQPTGYYPEGGDYEYFAIPWQTDTTTGSFPNGVLGLAESRGRLATCAACHQDAGEDFLYHR